MSSSQQHIVWTAVICEGGVGLLALGLGLLMQRPPWSQFEHPLENAAWGAVGAIPLLIGLWLGTRYPVGPLRALNELTRQMVVPAFRGCSLPDLALISALAGVGEELLFRGVVQEVIAHRFGLLVGLSAASTLFGLLHPLSRTYAVLTGLVGLYLGGLMLATESLVAPIVTHAVYDFVALVYLMRCDQAV